MRKSYLHVLLSVLILIAGTGIGVSGSERALNLILAYQETGTQKAEFTGVVCILLTPAQLNEVEKYFGEPCGVGVAEVREKSMAGIAGVLAGDILISVRMPDESEFYSIPSDFYDMAQFAEETEPIDGIRLLILRQDEGEYEYRDSDRFLETKREFFFKASYLWRF